MELKELSLTAKMIELSFSTRKIREICEDDEKAISHFGPEAAESLRHRLEDIRASSTIHDVLLGNLRPDETSPLGETLLLDLSRQVSMRIKVNHASVARKDNGMVDWHSVYRVQVVDFLSHRPLTE